MGLLWCSSTRETPDDRVIMLLNRLSQVRVFQLPSTNWKTPITLSWEERHHRMFEQSPIRCNPLTWRMVTCLFLVPFWGLLNKKARFKSKCTTHAVALFACFSPRVDSRDAAADCHIRWVRLFAGSLPPSRRPDQRRDNRIPLSHCCPPPPPPPPPPRRVACRRIKGKMNTLLFQQAHSNCQSGTSQGSACWLHTAFKGCEEFNHVSWLVGRQNSSCLPIGRI